MPASLRLHRAAARGLDGTHGVSALKAPFVCGHATIVYRTGETMGAFRMRCHSWGCTYCAPRLASKWRRTLKEAEFAPRTFATLTIDPKSLEALCGCAACRDPEEERRPSCLLLCYDEQHALFMKRWRLMLQKLRRIAAARGERLSYFRATENHGGGWDARRRLRNHREHWHILVSLDLGGGYRSVKDAPEGAQLYDAARDTFADLAAEFGFGLTMAYTVHPTNALVHSYLAKYASKGSTGNYLRVRHIAVSQDIRHPKLDPVDVLDHHIVSGPNSPSIEDLARRAPQLARTAARGHLELPRLHERSRSAAVVNRRLDRPDAFWIDSTAKRTHDHDRLAGDPRMRRTPSHLACAAQGPARNSSLWRARVVKKRRPCTEHVRIDLRDFRVTIERTQTAPES